MSKQDQQIFELMEKLFEEKLKPIKEDMLEIKEAINGNGKPGMLFEIDQLKSFRLRIYTIYAVLVAMMLGVGIYIRGFIEDLYKHVYIVK